MSKSSLQHEQEAAKLGPVTLAVVTVSDTRTTDDDANGLFLKESIKRQGHRLDVYHLIKDEPELIEKTCDDLTRSSAQVIIFNGGTGISRRDNTFDVLSKKLEKTLTGFGEIFRMLSYEEIGAAAMLSRATAGTYKNKVIILTPGSPNALKLAWKKLILPQLNHLAWELTR